MGRNRRDRRLAAIDANSLRPDIMRPRQIKAQTKRYILPIYERNPAEAPKEYT